MFCNTNKAKVRDSNPDASAKEIVQVLVMMWQGLKEEDKNKFERKALKENENRRAQLKDKSGGSGGGDAAFGRMVVFSFESNSTPLRTSLSGKSKYVPVLIDDVRKNLLSPKCKNGHVCTGAKIGGRRWGSCALCDRYAEAKKSCRICYYFVCGRCFQAYEDEQVKERSDPAGKHTFIRCEVASDMTLHVPPPSVDPTPPSADPTPQHPLQAKGAGTDAGPARAGAVNKEDSVAGQPGAAQAAGEDAGVVGGGSVQPAPGADFSITIELKLQALPANGQIAALARFSPPDFSQVRMSCVRASRVHTPAAQVVMD